MAQSFPSAGVFRVDAAGTVLAHTSVLNRPGERSRAVGRHFFEEVAPSTNCDDFRGRFEALLARGGGSESFTFRLRHPWATAEVRVRIVAVHGRSAWILIADPESAAAFEPSAVPSREAIAAAV